VETELAKISGVYMEPFLCVWITYILVGLFILVFEGPTSEREKKIFCLLFICLSFFLFNYCITNTRVRHECAFGKGAGQLNADLKLDCPTLVVC